MKKIIHLIQIIICLIRGFKYRFAKLYVEEKKYVPFKNRGLFKKMMRTQPFSDIYNKIFSDILTTRMVLFAFKRYFPKYFGICTTSGEKKCIKSLLDNGAEKYISFQNILSHIDSNDVVIVKHSDNHNLKNFMIIEKCEDWINVNGILYERKLIYEVLNKINNNELIMAVPNLDRMICERYGHEVMLFHVVFTKCIQGCHPSNSDFYLSYIDNSRGKRCSEIFLCHVEKDDDVLFRMANNIAISIFNQFRDIEYLDIAFLLTEEIPNILYIDSSVSAEYFLNCSQEIKSFLKEASSKHHVSIQEQYSNFRRYIFAFVSQRKGFTDFMYKNWLRGIKEDNRIKIVDRKTRNWAHKRGFYSYRIEQYGLTEENYKYILSDYDYKRCRPINFKYNKWFFNKIIAYYILRKFKTYIPEYYFKVRGLGNTVDIISFISMDACDMTDVLLLLNQKGKLVIKPAVGSHGKGFYVLQYIQNTDRYMVNNNVMSAIELENFIRRINGDFIISEYIEMNDYLKRIYDKTTGTVRIMTINDDNKNCIKHAYFRIGTKHTGYTDNLSSGGIAAKVDLETGSFGDAELLIDHKYIACGEHPDTGELIEGKLPYWDIVKKEIENICLYLTPLEYLGFDVVITNNGFKILEINTHQDLHKYPEYPNDVKDFLAKKVKEKRGSKIR